jgi:hypothetical protein
MATAASSPAASSLPLERPPLSDDLEALGLDPQLLVAALAGKEMRSASRQLRALVNSSVEGMSVHAEGLEDSTLRGLDRFPRLQRLNLRLARGGLGVAFADFAARELQSLSSLTKLQLSRNLEFEPAAARSLQSCCPQLQHLELGGSGAGLEK